jgi:hypothetical protein
MKILLVHPHYPDSFWSFRHALRLYPKSGCAPLGLITVSAMMPVGWEKMNTERKSKWEEQKEMLKQRISALTDGDLKFSPGRYEDMQELLHIKLDKTIKEIHETIDKLTCVQELYNSVQEL